MADDFDAQPQPDNTFEPTTFDVPQGDPDDGFELVEITHPDGAIEVEVPVGLSDEEVQGLQNYGNLIQQEKARQGVAFKGEVETMVARGIRNNNPGNIEYGTDQWDGMSATQDDDRFIKFESPEMGIRAMSKIMQTYKNKHGIDTVAGVINRWAPPSENDTSRYASYVASRMGIGVDDQVDLSDTAILSPLIQAMTFMENGENPYDEVVIGKGMQLAGLTPTKEEPPVNIAEGSVLEDVLAGLARLSPISSAAASEPTLPDSIDRADIDVDVLNEYLNGFKTGASGFKGTITGNVLAELGKALLLPGNVATGRIQPTVENTTNAGGVLFGAGSLGAAPRGALRMSSFIDEFGTPSKLHKMAPEGVLKGSDGTPVVGFRGSRGTQDILDRAVKGEASKDYAVFLSDNPHMSNSYAGRGESFTSIEGKNVEVAGVIAPYFIKADKVIEFPVDRTRPIPFDKFEFDRQAVNLKEGEVLVARNVHDLGPSLSIADDLDDTEGLKRWSYGSDVYATKDSSTLISPFSGKEVRAGGVPLPVTASDQGGATSSSLAGVGPGPRKPEAPNSVIAEAGPGPRNPEVEKAATQFDVTPTALTSFAEHLMRGISNRVLGTDFGEVDNSQSVTPQDREALLGMKEYLKGKGRTSFNKDDWAALLGTDLATTDQSGLGMMDKIVRVMKDPMANMAMTIGAGEFKIDKSGREYLEDVYDYNEGPIGKEVKKDVEQNGLMSGLSNLFNRNDLDTYTKVRVMGFIIHPKRKGNKTRIYLDGLEEQSQELNIEDASP